MEIKAVVVVCSGSAHVSSAQLNTLHTGDPSCVCNVVISMLLVLCWTLQPLQDSDIIMTSSWAGRWVPTCCCCSWTGSHMRAGGWGRYVEGDLSRQKTHRVSRSEVCSLDSGNGFPQSSHWKQTRFRQSSWGQQLLSDMFTQTMEGLFTVTESDLEDGTSCSFTPLLHDSWDLLHLLYVPQPDSPVLQRHRKQTLNCDVAASHLLMNASQERTNQIHLWFSSITDQLHQKLPWFCCSKGADLGQLTQTGTDLDQLTQTGTELRSWCVARPWDIFQVKIILM